MFSISDPAVSQRSVAALATYEAGETVLTAASVERIEELLGGANLVYAGYPYDPFAPNAPKN
jgi:hypothetical protein